MNTDGYTQIKTEPFESSTDLFQLETMADYTPTFGDLSNRRSSECTECNDQIDYECTSCMCQVCFHRTTSEKRYRCYLCRKSFHEWCRKNRENITAESRKWFCAECKELQERTSSQRNASSVDTDAKDSTTEVKPTYLLRKRRGTIDVNSNSMLANDDSDYIQTEMAVEKVFKKFIRKMHNAPRTKICLTVPSNHFGPIPGVPVGTCWKYRIQVSESGVHRPLVAGIHGRENEGAYSIVLSGVYQDDLDDGEQFYYSGCGGKLKDPRKRLSIQVVDQKLTRHNKALALCCNAPFDDVHGAEAKDWKAGKPVRVIRNYKLGKFSMYAPEEGNRYDGIYKVVKYFPATGKCGLLIWKYLLRRDDPSPPPWTEEGQRLILENNLKVIYPDEDVVGEYYSQVTRTTKIKRKIGVSIRKRPHDYNYYQHTNTNKLKSKFVANTAIRDSVETDGSEVDMDIKPDINLLKAELARMSGTAVLETVGSSNVSTVKIWNKPKQGADGPPFHSERRNLSDVSARQKNSQLMASSVMNSPPLSNRSSLNLSDQSNTSSSSINLETPTAPLLNITISQVSSNENATFSKVSDEMQRTPSSTSESPTLDVDELIIKTEKGYELPENIRNLIDKDKWNKSIWDYCKTYLDYSETEFLNMVRSLFQCPTCLKLIESPVTTPCEHNICLECISGHFSKKAYSCPQCHFFLGASFKFIENKYLGNALETLFPGYNFKLSEFI